MYDCAVRAIANDCRERWTYISALTILLAFKMQNVLNLVLIQSTTLLYSLFDLSIYTRQYGRLCLKRRFKTVYFCFVFHDLQLTNWESWSVNAH